MVLRQSCQKKQSFFAYLYQRELCGALSKKYLLTENSGTSLWEVSTEERGVDISNFFLCIIEIQTLNTAPPALARAADGTFQNFTKLGGL